MAKFATKRNDQQRTEKANFSVRSLLGVLKGNLIVERPKIVQNTHEKQSPRTQIQQAGKPLPLIEAVYPKNAEKGQ